MKRQTFPWFTPDWSATIDQINHFFRFYLHERSDLNRCLFVSARNIFSLDSSRVYLADSPLRSELLLCYMYRTPSMISFIISRLETRKPIGFCRTVAILVKRYAPAVALLFSKFYKRGVTSLFSACFKSLRTLSAY